MRIGEKSRPALLLVDFDERADVEVIDKIRAQAPTLRMVTSDGLKMVHQGEYDAAVVKGNTPSLAPHLQVLTCGATNMGSVHVPEFSVVATMRRNSVATVYEIPDTLPYDVRRLTMEDLVPLAQAEDAHWTFEGHVTIRRSPGEAILPLVGFLLDPDRKSLAGKFVRGGGQSSCWFVPYGADVGAWLSLALDEWSTTYPDRFPERSPWRDRENWQLGSEVSVRRQLRDVAAEMASAERAFTDRREALLLELEEAQRAGDKGYRLLLTAQGDELLTIVADALAKLGFEVTLVDADPARKGEKVEDLRVEAEKWVALAEVRGYVGGAKLNDLLRLERFVGLFVAEHGQRPERVWYVVNQLLERDPDARQHALSSHPEEVAEFATGGGVILDTRDLFRIVRAVDVGELSADAAREILKSAEGVFVYPPVSAG